VHDFNIFLGICFLFCGASDLFAALYLSAKVKSYEKSLEEGSNPTFTKVDVPTADTTSDPNNPDLPH